MNKEESEGETEDHNEFMHFRHLGDWINTIDEIQNPFGLYNQLKMFFKST